MDPVTAFGVAAAVVQFVDITSKVIKRLQELSHAGDVPKVFRDIRTRLPIVLQIVERTRDGIASLPPPTQVAVNEIVRTCYEHVEKIGEILNSVTVRHDDSRWRRSTKAVISLIQEERVNRVHDALKENMQLLTQLDASTGGKGKKAAFDERRVSIASPPPSYESSRVRFLVPFQRDDDFVGRQEELDAIHARLLDQERVAVAGIGGIGKSQVAIEFCYRFAQREPGAHVLWAWGGNAPRFKQAYKRIAQAMAVPGWDNPDADILQLVADWLSYSPTPYLLVLDNADNMKEWWPSKYAALASKEAEPGENLAQYLPECGEKGRILITSRDTRIASRLARRGKPIVLQPMSTTEARKLFLNQAAGEEDEFAVTEVDRLVDALDHIPLAISQAAAYLEENEHYTITDYLEALDTDEAEDFLQDELHDTRRDQDSINSIFRTWKLSFDQILAQKPQAANLLCMMSMLDRQSITKKLLEENEELRPDLNASISALQSFHMILLRASKDTFQLHRLVHRFLQTHARRSQTADKWRAAALKCVTKAYPVEIGAAQYAICDSLAPHVLALIAHDYASTDAQLDLATLLCWSADFAIETNEFALATQRAKKSLEIFERLVPESDGRRASSTWLYGRLLYYQARTNEDLDAAARILEKALRTSEYKTLNYAESAFELAHLYFDQGREEECLKIARQSFECWRDIEGADSQRSLDELHDYALELALFDRVEEAIASWNEVLRLGPISHDSTDATKQVYKFRSLANIAEFRDDPGIAEGLYAQLITLCGTIYNEHHVHIFDYRLCHSEQVLHQGRFAEAAALAREILADCKHTSEWQIRASSRRIMAECCRLQGDLAGEEQELTAALWIHEENLARSREETMAAVETLAHCLTRANQALKAEPLWKEIIAWRNERSGPHHAETLLARVGQGVCAAAQAQDGEAELIFLEVLDQSAVMLPQVVQNLCAVLSNQQKWSELEARGRQTLALWESAAGQEEVEEQASVIERHAVAVREMLAVALAKQGKIDEALAIRTTSVSLQSEHGISSAETAAKPGEAVARQACEMPAVVSRRRFGRMIHPRTWSA